MKNALSIDTLPQDIDSLKCMILDYHQEVERLKEQIKLMQHRRFGRKSEKSNGLQLSLFDEPKPEEVPENNSETIKIKSYTRKKHNRSLPKELARETKYYDLLDSEKICACGQALHKIGDDRHEQLDYIPAQVKVIEHIKAKYACKVCEEGIKIASAPKQPIPKSIASAGLLAQTITSKYVDHLPLYRQEAILSRIGVELTRATMANWVFKCAELLLPLVALLKERIILSEYARSDETTINVLSEKATAKQYIWVYMSGVQKNASVVFEYHPTRNGQIATNFFKDFKGYLQTDGFSGYNELREKQQITSLGCWAHARRKFFEIVKIAKKAGSAHIAVGYIDKLYKIEKNARCENLSQEQLLSLREKKSKPILKEFKIWLDKTIQRVPPSSALAKALKYTLNQWDTLIVYCEDARLDIDNNSIERMIKPFTCGRKNWLFCGNPKGAKASAILYSLVQTCRINSIDPYKYFRFVLTELPNLTLGEDLTKYLPQFFDSS